MRDFEEARESWQLFSSYTTLPELKAAVRCTGNEPSPLAGARSLCWKTFLLFESFDRLEWLRRTKDSRSAYTAVRTHLLQALENPKKTASDPDPLSEDVESPWAVLRQDEALRAEIMQDVDRCMPDNAYFRQPETQRMLLDILFVFCKLNPDVSYRQGMHELLAPILWVVERDAVASKSDGDLSEQDQTLYRVFDSDFIEHDSFTLFGIVMQGAKSFYEQAAHAGPSQLSTNSSKPMAKLENPILTRIHRIFDEYLPHVDPSLADHLRDIDLIPQVFLMKWIRLLFGREFAFDEVLTIWDVIFAEDPTLEIVDLVCVTMIIRLHWELIEADYNTALTSLLRYPAPTKGSTPQTLVLDALYLRDHLNQSGASQIIEKYSGKALASIKTSSSAHAQFPGGFGNRLQVGGLSPNRPGRNPANLEGLLQDAAKGMFKRGEQWGINKALRDAIVEVKKGVREIQNVPTPQAPRTHRRTSSRQSVTQDGVTEISRRLASLEQRNLTLAKMLKIATDDLWKYHESAVAGKALEKDDLEMLGMAIAKVQFTQVYLEDSTVPLPTDDQPVIADDTEVKPEGLALSEKTDETNEKVETSTEQGIPPAPSKSRPKKHLHSGKEQSSTISAEAPLDFQTPRPTLSQSSFSWMLGQGKESGSFAQASSLPPSDARRQSRGFLFGDENPSFIADSPSSLLAKGKGANKLRKKRPEGTAEVLFEQDSEEWDLGKLEEEKEMARKEQEEMGQAKAREGGV